jgi:hypothetical protein
MYAFVPDIIRLLGTNWHLLLRLIDKDQLGFESALLNLCNLVFNRALLINFFIKHLKILEGYRVQAALLRIIVLGQLLKLVGWIQTPNSKLFRRFLHLVNATLQLFDVGATVQGLILDCVFGAVNSFQRLTTTSSQTRSILVKGMNLYWHWLCDLKWALVWCIEGLSAIFSQEFVIFHERCLYPYGQS